MDPAFQASVELTARQRDALAERMLQAAQGVFDIYSIYIGDQLGFYKALDERGPMTAGELAACTATHERYVQEWLEQQGAAGFLEVENPGAGSLERRFFLPAGHAEVLVERDSLNYLAPLAQIMVGVARPVAEVVEAYRSGGGVPYARYGKDMREGQAGMNRAMFLHQLGQEWLPAIPDVHARLQAGPPAKVADIGMGAGWSSIGMAQNFPKILVDGFDLDEASIALAQENIRAAGLEDRVTAQVRDAADPLLAGQYDLVTAFEALHDMSDPVGVLRAMRRLINRDGAVIVVDERVGESFTSLAGQVENLMYGYSILHCLPAGMAEQPSAGTGTVMRTSTLESYARQAGFQKVEILPIDNMFFRVYRLIP
jgi:2-polyprenyl-3-methyl-5-hydroxy-6-metoxy-1,4-benzoquinol methylase